MVETNHTAAQPGNRYLRIWRALVGSDAGEADPPMTGGQPLHAMSWLRVHRPSVAGDLFPSFVGVGMRLVKFAVLTAASCIMSLLPDLPGRGG